MQNSPPFERALQAMNAGDLQGANRWAVEATRASPRDFDSWHLLGYTFAALGQLADALSAYERAAALKVDHADFHNNHGNALRMLGRHEEAIKAYDRALRRAPNKAEPYYNRGMSRATLGQLEAAFSDFHTATCLAPKLAPAHYELGRVLGVFNRNAEALAAFDAALALRPQWPEAHSCRGEMLLALNRIEESRAALERALDLNPQMPVTWGLLGLVRTAAKDFPAAVSCYERSLNLHPDDPIVLSNFSNVLLALDRKDEAADACRKALALAPGFVDAHNNLGNAQLALEQYEDALASFDRALDANPRSPEAWNNRGTACLELGRLDQALESFRQAAAKSSVYVQPVYNECLLLLLQGRWAEGWALYEQRRRMPNWVGTPDGPELERLEDAAGRSVLLYAEQGLGDTLQFCRYALLLAAHAGKVILQAQRPLVPLLRQSLSGIEIIANDEDRPAFDRHLPLMSLMRLLGTTEATILASVPYLKAESGQVEAWRARLGAHGFKVGIVWQGSKGGAVDRGRSYPLAQAAPLAAIPGVRLISLQKNDGVEQLMHLPHGMAVETLGDAFDTGPGAFLDTVAVMQALDLVVTSDTAVAHLAGALGVRTWIALKYTPDWRWLLTREDSPWYPTMRLFRPQHYSDWAGIFARMAAALREIVP